MKAASVPVPESTWPIHSIRKPRLRRSGTDSSPGAVSGLLAAVPSLTRLPPSRPRRQRSPPGNRTKGAAGRWRGGGVGSVSVEGTRFLSVLRQLAEADPDRPALTCAEVTLSRAEFLERVERLAGLFAARGVTEGSTVPIVLGNSIGLVECLFAAWAIGAVPQPISHRLPPLE